MIIININITLNVIKAFNLFSDVNKPSLPIVQLARTSINLAW